MKQAEKKRLYLIAGGGTSGHVNPALAVVEALQQMEPESDFLYLVTATGIEAKLAHEAGLKTEVIQAAGLPPQRRLGSLLCFVWQNACGFCRALTLLHRYKPRAVLGTGGYVSAPLIQAASLLRYPFLLHEQNAYPGRVNRRFARQAEIVALSFAKARDYLSADSSTFVSGNPIRRAFFETSRQTAREKLGLTAETELILILGGSLGAQSINQALLDFVRQGAWQRLRTERPQLRIVLSTGLINGSEALTRELREAGIQCFEQLPTELWMPAADLLLSRAGSSALMECAACALPAILLPFPAAANDHQRYNAEAFAEKGAAIVLADSELSAERLDTLWRELLEGRERRLEMGRRMHELAEPDAARKIAEMLSRIGDKP